MTSPTLERVPYQTLLATGGNETTAQLLSNLTLLLSQQPWILEALRERPELRPSAVEEALRFVSPVTGMFRHTTTPVERHGVTIPDDAKVLLMYGAANHDERHYDRPDEFVIDRYPRGFADADHLAFASGVHVCLGAHLARGADRRLPRAHGPPRPRHRGDRARGAVAQRARARGRRAARAAGPRAMSTAAPVRRGRPRLVSPATALEPREEILREASRLFSARGVPGTRLSDIAAAVGITPPTIYYHFENLAAIVEALLTYVVDESAAFATVAARRDGPCADRLAALVTQHVERLTTGPYDLWFVVGLSEDPPHRYPAVSRKAREWRRAVARLVTDGIDRGELRPIDVTLAVAAVSGLVHAALELRHDGVAVDPTEVARLAVAALRP